MATEVDSRNFDQEVSKAKKPVIVDFWADWCMPCRMMAPVFEELSKEYTGKLKFVKIDIMQNQDLAQTYNVQGIPNLIIFNKGKPVGQLVGYMQKADLKRKIDQVLNQ